MKLRGPLQCPEPRHHWHCVSVFVSQAFLSARHSRSVRALKPFLSAVAARLVWIRSVLLLTVRPQNDFSDAASSCLRASEEMTLGLTGVPVSAVLSGYLC